MSEVWKDPKTRYHYLAVYARRAHCQGYREGVVAAVDFVKGLAAEAFLADQNAYAETLKNIAARIGMTPALEEPTAEHLDNVFRVLPADDEDAEPFLAEDESDQDPGHPANE